MRKTCGRTALCAALCAAFWLLIRAVPAIAGGASPAVTIDGQAAYIGAADRATAGVEVWAGGAAVASANVNWLSVSPAQVGPGAAQLTLTALANPYARPRSGLVTLTGSGASASVRVWQDAADRAMAPGSRYLGALVDGGAAHFTFAAPADGFYTFHGESDALTLAPALQIDGGAPTTGAGGDFDIALSLRKGQSVRLTLREQSGAAQGEFCAWVTAGGLSAGASAVYLPADGGQSDCFTLDASAPWTAAVSGGWLRVTPSSGGAGQYVLRAEAGANDGEGLPRKAAIEFTSAIDGAVARARVEAVQPAPRVDRVLSLDGYCQAATARGSAAWFRFNAPAAGYYAFSSAGAPDMRGGLYTRVGGSRLAYDDNGAGGRNFRVVRGLKAGQTVWLKAYGASGRVNGAYRVSAATVRLALNSRAIELPGAGGSAALTLQANAPWKGSSGASWLKLSKTAGNGAGEYRLTVKAAANSTGVTRTATLKFTAAGRIAGLTITQRPTSADPVLLQNVPRAGALAAGRANYYVFTASDAGTYIFETTGAIDTAGALYAGRGGSRLAYNANSGAGSNFRIARSLKAGQRVWLKVYGGRPGVAGGYAASARHAEVRLGAAAVYLPNLGGSTPKVALSSDLAWKASSSASWLTPGVKSGKAGAASIYARAAANRTGVSRTAALTLTSGGRKFRLLVTQPAIPDAAMAADVRYGGRIERGSGAWYAFTAPSAGTYAFTLDGAVAGRLTLHAAKTGPALRAASGANARLTYPMKSGAVAYLMVTGATTAAEGDYGLIATRTSAPTGRGRALVVSESSATNGVYASAGERALEKTVGQYNLSGVSSMLARARVGGSAVAVSTMKNPSSWPALRGKILSTFAGAAESDVSYLYIHAHGLVEGGQYYLYVGSSGQRRVSAAELKATLDQVPGRVVLLVESCYSGSLIASGSRSAAPSFAEGFAQTFAPPA
ncbi:MAG: BACON domain-containing protein, partial [Clostridiales bacterium]|nr:BACON domain-containing protein [Clostridiales bacterium]